MLGGCEHRANIPAVFSRFPAGYCARGPDCAPCNYGGLLPEVGHRGSFGKRSFSVVTVFRRPFLLGAAEPGSPGVLPHCTNLDTNFGTVRCAFVFLPFYLSPLCGTGAGISLRFEQRIP